MTGRWLILFDDQGLRPGVVTAAAVTGVFVGGVMLTAGMVVALSLVGPGSVTLLTISIWLLAAIQVTAPVLMIVGGLRLAMGVGRTALVVGAVLELVACLGNLLFVVLVVWPEPADTSVFVTTVTLVFALLAATVWFGATRPAATEYVRLAT